MISSVLNFNTCLCQILRFWDDEDSFSKSRPLTGGQPLKGSPPAHKKIIATVFGEFINLDQKVFCNFVLILWEWLYSECETDSGMTSLILAPNGTKYFTSARLWKACKVLSVTLYLWIITWFICYWWSW